MANYRIVVQYDGTRYKGWQRQRMTGATIQGKLEAILEKQFGFPIEVNGSGRTDAGVHARAQTANFRVPGRVLSGTEQERCALLAEIFAEYLPEDIAVVSVKEASERFHSRFNVVSKTYVYRIWNEPYPQVFERKYTLHRTEDFDLEAMRKAAEYLVGEHDFAAFCGNAKMKKSTVRDLREIRIAREGGEIRFTFTGNGFLQNMVRILVGTLAEAGLHKFPPEHVKEILEGRERSQAGPLMPAQGLTLWEVVY